MYSPVPWGVFQFALYRAARTTYSTNQIYFNKAYIPNLTFIHGLFMVIILIAGLEIQMTSLFELNLLWADMCCCATAHDWISAIWRKDSKGATSPAKRNTRKKSCTWCWFCYLVVWNMARVLQKKRCHQNSCFLHFTNTQYTGSGYTRLSQVLRQSDSETGSGRALIL